MNLYNNINWIFRSSHKCIPIFTLIQCPYEMFANIKYWGHIAIDILNDPVEALIQSVYIIKGSPVHVAPACAGSGEGSDHFGSIVRSLSLHFCKRLFLPHEQIAWIKHLIDLWSWLVF